MPTASNKWAVMSYVRRHRDNGNIVRMVMDKGVPHYTALIKDGEASVIAYSGPDKEAAFQAAGDNSE